MKLIVNSDVVQENNDTNQFFNQIKQANEVLVKECTVACADAGYSKVDNMKEIDEMKPKVSIMIPVYNQEKYIANAIQSALNQDYNNIEIIISDDASTDNTAKIIKKYLPNPKIKYNRNKTNIGRVKNYRKLLFELTRGYYVINLDGDDILIDNSFITKSVGRFNTFSEKNPVALFGCIQLNCRGSLRKYYHKVSCPNGVLIPGINLILGYNIKYKIAHLATLYKREAAVNCNFHSKDVLGSDAYSLLRLCINNNVIVSNDIAGQWNRTGFNESLNFTFHDGIKKLEWILDLKKTILKSYSIPKYVVYLWLIRRKIDTSTSIILSLMRSKRINYYVIKELYNNRLLFIVIFTIIKTLISRPLESLKFIILSNFRKDVISEKQIFAGQETKTAFVNLQAVDTRCP